MKENKAEEKLRVIDIIKENATMVLTIGGFMWIIYSFIILPITQLQYQVGNIINNHLKTIQDEQVSASQERKVQGIIINTLNENIVRLQEQLKIK